MNSVLLEYINWHNAKSGMVKMYTMEAERLEKSGATAQSESYRLKAQDLDAMIKLKEQQISTAVSIILNNNTVGTMKRERMRERLQHYLRENVSFKEAYSALGISSSRLSYWEDVLSIKLKR
jgi:hypothetical protein